MADSNRLSRLQIEFLEAWFGLSTDYFLTGGAALIGFYGSPRMTEDLDLFTTHADSFAQVSALVHDCNRQLGTTATSLVASPHFRRYRFARGAEVTLVDFVEELAPQVFPEKSQVKERLRLDPAEEIAVNKVCAIVSRSEPRDFYDLHYLSTRGVDPDLSLRLALQKDSGVTPETLAFVLQSIPWNHFRIPGLDVSQVVQFFQNWLDRLILGLCPDPGGKLPGQ